MSIKAKVLAATATLIMVGGKADPADKRLPQIKVRHLIGNPAHVPDRQLWGRDFGIVN